MSLLTVTVNEEDIYFIWWRLQIQSSFRISSNHDDLNSEEAESDEMLIVQQTETCEKGKKRIYAYTN